jgi:dTDP-4-amino-4,6-dideoxygalactose transaminase
MDIHDFIHPLLTAEDKQAVINVLNEGVLSDFRGAKGDRYYGGKYVRQLEDDFKEYIGTKYAVSFNSATAALHAACIIAEVKEAIVTPFSFSSSASCVNMVGGTPVFCDIEDETWCMDTNLIKGLITPNTNVIIPVDLCGHPASAVEDIGLFVIEDASQAVGATFRGRRTGTFGDCGVFSFNECKHLACGEGGMLTTNREDVWEKACWIRNHGEAVGELLGYNYRLGEMEAALISSQLKRLEKQIEQRVEMAEYLTYRLSHVDELTCPLVKPDCTHVYYTYGITVKRNRDKIVEYINAHGVYMGAGYNRPLNRLPIHNKGNCPVADRMFDTELMMTCITRPPATLSDMKYVANVIEEAIRHA